MTETEMSKLEVARRQLECAIRLRLASEDSLAVHTLAYAAFSILRDLILTQGHDMQHVLDILRDRSSKMGRDFSAVPNFLKHAKSDPDGMLTEHSWKNTDLTLVFAVRLWRELGNEPTPVMWEKLPNPYKPQHRASELMEFAGGPLLSEQDETEWRERLEGITRTATS